MFGRKRWLIFLFLFAFTFVAYLQRTAVSVVAVPMMPALGLSQLQIGWLETAFLISYTALQFPGGLLGQRLGAHRMLTITGALSVAATLAIPALPGLVSGTTLFVALLAAQFTLGVAQAPLFALMAGALERWFPPHQWALTEGLSASGIGLGAAATPAAVATLMLSLGWRAALLVVSLPMVALAWAWWRHGGNTPFGHPGITAEELAELRPEADEPAAKLNWRHVRRLLANRNLAGLTFSYTAMNVVFYLITFWSFLYLVQARHLPVLDSGLLATVPLLGGAAGAALGGIAGTALTRKFGARTGLRIVPLVCLPGAAALLLISVHAASAGMALAGLTVAFGLLEMTEGPFWAASMEIGGTDSVAASAILNTGGNVGGIIATPIVAYLSGGGHWTAPFVLGGGCAVLAALAWVVIDPGARCEREEGSASF